MRKRVLSTLHSWAVMPFWNDLVDSIPLEEAKRPGGIVGAVQYGARELARGVQLWWASRHYDAVITDSSPHVAVFGLLQRLPFVRKRRHLMLECLWSWPSKRIPFERLAKSLQYRASVSPYTRAVHYASVERRPFSECFGIPIERFVFIPYHTTLFFERPGDETAPPPRPDRYLFAGGDGQRDYATLFRAVDGLDVPVVIAIRDRQVIAGLPIPKNVEIVTTSHADFLRWMRHAFINVVPLRADFLRTGGHQTFLNAMAFATVAIVTDGARTGDYITNWKDGVLIPAGDDGALRDAIVRVMNDPALAERLRRNASSVKETHSTERILNLYIQFLLSDEFLDPARASYGVDGALAISPDPDGSARLEAAAIR